MATSAIRKSAVYEEKYLQLFPMCDLPALNIASTVFRVLGWISIFVGILSSVGLAMFINDLSDNFGLAVLAFLISCFISGITVCMLFCLSEIISLMLSIQESAYNAAKHTYISVLLQEEN